MFRENQSVWYNYLVSLALNNLIVFGVVGHPYSCSSDFTDEGDQHEHYPDVPYAGVVQRGYYVVPEQQASQEMEHDFYISFELR